MSCTGDQQQDMLSSPRLNYLQADG